MSAIFNHLKSVQRLSSAAEESLRNALKPEQMKKGDFLIKEGQVCRRLYFVEEGCLRGYYNKDGKEITHWFGFENDFVTSFYSFTTEKPAIENIQLLEDTKVQIITKTDMDRLCDEFTDISKLVRRSYENYYVRLEEKYVNNQFRQATDRYRDLIENRPHFIQRIPLRHIASFLGISQETLSRIRAEI